MNENTSKIISHIIRNTLKKKIKIEMGLLLNIFVQESRKKNDILIEKLVCWRWF